MATGTFVRPSAGGGVEPDRHRAVVDKRDLHLCAEGAGSDIDGVVGALLLPFLVALVAAGALAEGGLLLILFLALIGAVIVLLIARLIAR